MKYHQQVKIKNTDFEIAAETFHDIKLVEFLTYLQPIKIINWAGIENGKLAFFKLWFCGWKNFKVKHSNYKRDKNELSFIDIGVEMPLGIRYWCHKHIVKKNKKNIIIIDSLNIEHANLLIGYILFPIFITPIFIRIILYKRYFKKLIRSRISTSLY